MSQKNLKKGYTTGAHSVAAFRSCLDVFINTKQYCFTKTIKIDNDDLDVTKGCEIIVSISSKLEDLKLNSIKQQGQKRNFDENCLEVFAGEGVGIVTKKGLKIPPNFPAINPSPLNSIFEYFELKTNELSNINIFCTISVKNGEEIAKQTANSKVGVLGGISILGTTGIVKPISSSAYIDSVKTEIKFAKKNDYKVVYFTLGNSAFNIACKKTNKEAIVEIGNFVHDSISIANKLKIQKVIFLCGIGKMTKVYQGFKNTHNRFGVIDFELLKADIKKELAYEVDIKSTLTVKGISQELEKIGLLEAFYELITKKANEQIKKWFPKSNVEAIILEQREVLGW